jgi:DDE family transposase
LAEVAWALHQTRRDGRPHGQVRANFQLDTRTWAPQVVSVSGDDGSEPAAFAKDLLEGVLYVIDRNFVDFAFLGRVLARGSDFVLRVRDNAPAVEVLDEIPLTAADAQEGVVADQVVRLTGAGAPQGRFRLVTIRTSDRKGRQEIIRLLSSLTDPHVPARVIGEAYRLRWQIELFFKWLKTFARMDHLLSTSRNGITFQLYVAVIGVLMMCAQTGRRVSVYALAALARLASGEFTLDQAMQVIARRERERELNRARQAKRRARKKLA